MGIQISTLVRASAGIGAALWAVFLVAIRLLPDWLFELPALAGTCALSLAVAPPLVKWAGRAASARSGAQLLAAVAAACASALLLDSVALPAGALRPFECGPPQPPRGCRPLCCLQPRQGSAGPTPLRAASERV